jgi:type VI secretion system secreted protein Hcp
MKSARIAAFALIAALAVPSLAAETNYVFIKGQKTGNINGSVTVKGQENSILVDSVSHEIVSPRDAATGLPTGQRMHKPLVLVVPVDKAWPLLMNVLTTNENLVSVVLRTVAPDARTGATSLQRTITLTNANISDVQQYTVDATNGTPSHDVLKISLTYQKIQWTWVNGGITATDDWEARN